MTNKTGKLVSIYRHAKDNAGYKKEFEVTDLPNAIKSGAYKATTLEYRRLLNDPKVSKKTREDFKLNKFKGVTWSGLFSERNSKSLVKHTGLICIDIDKIPEEKFAYRRQQLIEDQFSYIVFISPSGVGLKVIVKTDCDNAADHKKKYFPMLQEYYDNSYGIEIDKSGCNVDRLCFLAWDESIFVNEESDVISLGELANDDNEQQDTDDPAWGVASQTHQAIIARGTNDIAETIEQVTYCVNQLTEKKIDITVGYSNWLKVGMALATLGEEGRDLFHKVSSMNADYDYGQSDKKFTNFLKINSASVNIGSFFFACKEQGVAFERPVASAQPAPIAQADFASKAEWKDIYAYIHAKNRAGDKWSSSDIKFLSKQYLVSEEKIEATFVKIFEKYKDKFNLDNKPDIFRVEDWLNSNYEFQRNEITQKEECRPLNIDMEQNANGDFVRINKNSIYRHLQRDGFKFAMDKLSSLLKSDFIKTVNPFTEYFFNLPVQYAEPDDFDHITHLSSFIQMEDQEFWASMFKKALVRSIACGIGGRENRIVMVMVQEDQNTGKSSFIRFLNPFGAKYYTEAPLRDGKDTEFRFAENFIYNLEELASLNALDINKLKAIISKTMVKERKPFAEDELEMPRRCNFWASTNKPEFLTDNQNTRWLCFKVKSINHNYRHLDTGKIEVDINKVWAQAYRLYTEGFNYQLTLEETSQRDKSNKEYEQSSTEKDLVTMNFEVADQKTGDFKNLTEIEDIINRRTEYRYKLNRLALGRALTQLGFISDRKFLNGQQVRGYYLKLILKSLDYEGEESPF